MSQIQRVIYHSLRFHDFNIRDLALSFLVSTLYHPPEVQYQHPHQALFSVRNYRVFILLQSENLPA